MAHKRDSLQKIHGIPRPTEPSNPKVIARLKLHKAATRWCAKWLTPLQAFFALIGLVVVLLPMLLKPWRAVIESTPILERIFHDYSTFSGLALANLLVGMLTALLKIYLAKDSAGDSTMSYQDMMSLEAYPRTKKEEITFWTNVMGTIFATTVWLFIPFGVLAYFIRIGN